MKFRILFFALLIKFSSSLWEGCDFFQKLSSTSVFTIKSPGYPDNYARGTQCRWAAEAPPGFKIVLDCQEVQLPLSASCLGDNLSVSPMGRGDLSDAKRHCGSAPFQIESTSYRMTIALSAGNLSRGGKFRCSVRSVKNNCGCGTRNKGRIGNYGN